MKKVNEETNEKVVGTINGTEGDVTTEAEITAKTPWYKKAADKMKEHPVLTVAGVVTLAVGVGAVVVKALNGESVDVEPMNVISLDNVKDLNEVMNEAIGE